MLVLAPLAVFIGLAVLASGADGRLAGDGAVMDALNWLAPVSSDDVHIDPVLHVTTLIVSALLGVLVVMRLLARDFRAAAYVVVAVTIPVLLSRGVKEVVERPAIEGPRDSYTFPSGSATWCAAAVVALVLLSRSERERRTIGLVGGALTLTYSAIIAWEEWHHPSDVLGGWCLGMACASAAWIALARPSAPLTAL